MKKKLSVSLMCADLLNMERDVKKLESCGIDWFHLDVMDAHLVPNLTFGPDFVNQLKRITNLPLDVHLMIDDPIFILNCLQVGEGDYVTLHSEIDDDILDKNIAIIKAKGAKVGLALNPETPIEKIGKWINQIDLVLLMLVRPGFAGGKMIEGIMDKVKQTKNYLIDNDREDIIISTDGNITPERAQYMATLGADVFVGGTSAVFRKNMQLADAVQSFYQMVKG